LTSAILLRQVGKPARWLLPACFLPNPPRHIVLHSCGLRPSSCLDVAPPFHALAFSPNCPAPGSSPPRPTPAPTIRPHSPAPAAHDLRKPSHSRGPRRYPFMIEPPMLKNPERRAVAQDVLARFKLAFTKVPIVSRQPELATRKVYREQSQCDNVKYFTHGFRHSCYGHEDTEVGSYRRVLSCEARSQPVGAGHAEDDRKTGIPGVNEPDITRVPDNGSPCSGPTPRCTSDPNQGLDRAAGAARARGASLPRSRPRGTMRPDRSHAKVGRISWDVQLRRHLSKPLVCRRRATAPRDQYGPCRQPRVFHCVCFLFPTSDSFGRAFRRSCANSRSSRSRG